MPAPGVDEEVRSIGGNGHALDLVGRAREVVEPLRQVLRLRAHLAEELSRVTRLQTSELVRVALEDRRQSAEKPRAVEAGHRHPGTRERRAGRTDGALDV